jgi:hypothetical protein
MDLLNKIIVDIELHSVEGIRNCFSQGLSPNELFRGEPLIYELVSEYTRTPRFKDCVKTFAEHGLEMEDRILLAVLQDDAENLNRLLQDNPEAVFKKYTLRCAYTPMYKVTLLHICAEYNHTACAKILVRHGADVNAAAGTDENGFGGQTPIFHTVNQNGNQSADMMNYLLSQAADLKITVPGFIWGRGYDWETLIPAVNPVSYAAMGLLPQMHRDEKTIAQTVTLLLKQAYGIDYTPGNVPNKYLKG